MCKNQTILLAYFSWVLYVNGKERITDCPAVNDGRWHHIGVSWRSEDGDWRVYIDGNPSDGGKGLSTGTKIPGKIITLKISLCVFQIILASFAVLYNIK